MSPIHALFDELVDLPPPDRARRLAALAPDVARTLAALLDADGRRVALLETPVAAAIETLRDEDEQLVRDLVGTRIGTFRIVDFVAQGGTAAVFRAERPAGLGSQLAALKLLRTGLCSRDAQRRFLREQAILAQLSHPDIARLIEGGVSESGIPYIAMEFVAGTPITRAADERRLGLEARLELFLRLCRAVQAAHASLVVHCDLKPSNVLVDASGALKVLDFGIAKLADSDSQADRTLGLALTPEYAAPEQFRRDAPAVSVDVFALGVILGELLTGQRLRGERPAGASSTLADHALHEPPPGLPPRERLARRLRGDLDAIIDTALAQDPAQRYRSAEALARDIERHLAGYPIRARPASRAEQVRKFLGRHRTAVSAAATFVVAMLLALGFAISQGVQARREAATARIATARADSLREFMFDAFAEAAPSVPRDGPATVVDAVERALANIAVQRDGDPRVKLELQSSLAQVLSRQGAHDRAADVFADALSQARRHFGDDDALALEIEYHGAKNLGERGDWQASRDAFDALLPRIPDGAEWVRTAALTTSSWLAGRMHEREPAYAQSEEAVRLARASGDARRIEQALRARGTVLVTFGDGEQAVRVYEDLLARQRAQYGPVHARVAAESAALSRAYRLIGDLERAERHARAALEIDEQVYPALHWHKALHLNALAMVQIQARAYDAALATTRAQLEIQEATLKAEHPDNYGTYQTLGVLHGHLGDAAEAERWTRAALEGYARLDMERSWAGIRAIGSHAHALAKLGRRGEAEAQLARAFAIAPAGIEADLLADLHERRARIALDAGDLAAAERPVAELAAVVAGGRTEPRWAIRSAVTTAELRWRRGDLPGVRAALEAGAAGADALRPGDPALEAAAVLLRAIAAQAGDAAQARALVARAAESYAAVRYPPRHLVQMAESLSGARR